MEQTNQVILPIEVSIVVSQHNGVPCLEMRRTVKDLKLFKQILSCAFHGQPITIVPVFRDKYRSLGTLTEKGILTKEGENFYFTI